MPYSNSGLRPSGGAPAVGTAAPNEYRPRGGAPVRGVAVPRSSVPNGGGGGGYYPPGYWGGYYPYYPPYWGSYYPGWGWGGYLGWGFGLSWYYDPFWWGGYPYSVYVGYPGYGYADDPGYGYAAEPGDVYYNGSIKLKVKPKRAEVYVDGYYVGIVDDFDGMFQDLDLSADPSGRIAHRVEIRAAGAQPLVFEARLQPGQTITYRGELIVTDPKR